MSAKSFTIPIVTVHQGRAQLPPQLGAPTEAAFDDPRAVVKAWIQQGARRIYLVDGDAVIGHDTNHGSINAAISAAHGHALVDLESGVSSQSDLEIALSTGCHRVVINATDPILADALRQQPKRIAVKLGIHESAFSTHVTARDASDLWSLIERLEDWGVHQYVLVNTDRQGHWRHKSLKLLEAVLESIRPPAVAFSGISHLEDLHRLTELSSKGLEGAASSHGLYSGAFTLAEAEAAVEPRFDPYIWAPADPNLPQVSDVSGTDPSAPPVSSL